MSFDKSYFMIPQGFSKVGAPSDAVNSLSPFSISKTNINSDTSLYLPSAAAGGSGGGGGSSISAGTASVVCDGNANSVTTTANSVTTTSADSVTTTANSVTTTSADSVTTTAANSVTTTAKAIVNTIQGNANYISNTTDVGANLFIGSLNGGGNVSNNIYAQTSSFICQYNLQTELLNGLAPPIIFSLGFNRGQQITIAQGTSSATYNLPALSAQGYVWAAVVTPWASNTQPYWCVVNGDVLTVSVPSNAVADINFNLIASASK